MLDRLNLRNRVGGLAAVSARKAAEARADAILRLASSMVLAPARRIARPPTGGAEVFRTVERETGARLILKIDAGRPPDAIAADVRFQARMAERLDGQPGLAVPQIVWWSAQAGAVLMSEAPGRPLERFWGDEAVDAYARVGTWLKAFHKTAGLRLRGFDPERAVLIRGSPEGLKDRTDWLQEQDRLLQMAAELRGVEISAGLAHGDFHPGNVIVSKDQVTGLDLGKRQRGATYRDVARILAPSRVVWRGAMGREGPARARYEANRAALLNGYGGSDARVLDVALLRAALRWWVVVGTQTPVRGDRERLRRLRRVVRWF